MNLEIKEDYILFLDGKSIFKSDRKIYRAIPYDETRIVVKIKAGPNNILCIDRTGKVLWYAQSPTPNGYPPYQAFDIRNGAVYAVAEVGGMGINVKIDPMTGKIVEKEITR